MTLDIYMYKQMAETIKIVTTKTFQLSF